MIEKNSMIEITDTQSDIMKAFLTPGKDKKGLSSPDLKKLGVNRKTFENHHNFLLNNGLIRISHQEEHGIQTWNYYQLTTMGLLTLFHHVNDDEIKKIMKHHGESLPLIAKHWTKISRMYGVYMIDILRRIVDSFDVDKRVYAGAKKGSEVSLHINPSSVITLRFQDCHMILKKEVGFDPYEETEERNDENENFTKFSHIVSRDFTFEFYFYLLSLPFESDERTNIWWGRHVSLENDTLKIRDNAGDHLESSNRFLEKIKQNSLKILSIIRKDSELSKLFVEWLDIIDKKFQKPRIISDLQQAFK